MCGHQLGLSPRPAASLPAAPPSYYAGTTLMPSRPPAPCRLVALKDARLNQPDPTVVGRDFRKLASRLWAELPASEKQAFEDKAVDAR